jgi:hypothetical protein
MADTDIDFTDSYNTSRIRKWGTKIAAVAPMSVVFPTRFFDATTNIPLALPSGTRVLGAIDTDGIKQATSVKTDEVDIDQSTAPARVDMTSKTSTLQAKFMEATAWTHALRSGIPLEQWPETADAAFSIDEADASDYPFMRLFIIARDGVGADAKYRVEAALKAQVSDVGDRSLARSSSESFDTTFTFFQDEKDAARRSYVIRQDGPGYTAHLTEPTEG